MCIVLLLIHTRETGYYYEPLDNIEQYSFSDAFFVASPLASSCVDRKASDLGLGGMHREYLQTDCAINRVISLFFVEHSAFQSYFFLVFSVCTWGRGVGR